MPKLNLVVIGYRNHSKRIIDILNKNLNIKKIVCFCYKKSIVKKLNSENLSKKIIYTNNKKVLKNYKNFIISSPSKTHNYYIKSLLKFAKYIYCEKPGINKKSDILFLKKLNKKKKQKIFFGYNLLHSEVYNVYKKILKRKGIGKPIYASIKITNGIAYLKKFKNNWRFKSKSTFEKITGNIGIHYINMFAHLFGEINEINFKEKGVSNNNICDTSNISVLFKNKTYLQIYLSYAAPFSEEIVIYFSNGIVKSDNKKTSLYYPRNTFDKFGMFTHAKEKKLLKHPSGWGHKSLNNSINFFVNSIKNKKKSNLNNFNKAIISSLSLLGN